MRACVYVIGIVANCEACDVVAVSLPVWSVRPYVRQAGNVYVRFFNK